VSHETLYKTLYVQARGALKKELIQYLRRKRQLRGSRHTQKGKDRRGSIPDAISISERPPEVEDRAVPGHWEGDLICGPNHSFIGTLVERHSRYVMLMKLSDRKTENVVNALIKHASRPPDELYKTLPWDRGHELAEHKRFTVKTNVDVYFCDPQSLVHFAYANCTSNAGVMRTRTDCSANTSPKARIYLSIAKRS